jgi:DNA (cytosine-5)-methyltransferase 1
VTGEVLHEMLARISKSEQECIRVPASRIVHLRPHVRTRTFWRDGQVFAGDVSYYADAERTPKEANQMNLW